MRMQHSEQSSLRKASAAAADRSATGFSDDAPSSCSGFGSHAAASPASSFSAVNQFSALLFRQLLTWWPGVLVQGQQWWAAAKFPDAHWCLPYIADAY
jgi:hypothetical protein